MLKRIFAYMKPYKKYLIFAIVCVFAETMFELVIPLIMADIVDIGVASGDTAYIFKQGVLMVVCALIALLPELGEPGFLRFAARGWAPS